MEYVVHEWKDRSIIGDSINIDFTAFCVCLGWESLVKKLNFNTLPLIISNEITSYNKPYVFELLQDIILEVLIHHPNHKLLSMLNLH